MIMVLGLTARLEWASTASASDSVAGVAAKSEDFV